MRLPLAALLAAITLGAVTAAASSGDHSAGRVGADGGVVISSIPAPADAPGPPSTGAPLTVPSPGISTPARSTAPQIAVSASDLAADSIPSTAVAAYQGGANAQTVVDAGCRLRWPLLAGIGRVESDHGRFAGAVLHTDGVSTPKIIGIALDGHGTALIRDTDHGRLDGDTVYDRAVGPMQFIPSTWASYGMDGNRDHRADPFNTFDAARTAARYLCAVGTDLSTTAGQVQAILAYNDSDAYVSLVMQVESEYAHGAGILAPTPPATSTPAAGKPKVPPADPGAPLGVPANPTASPTATAPATVSTTPSTAPPVSSDPAPPSASPTGAASSSAGASPSAPGSDTPTTPPQTSPDPTDALPSASPTPSTIPATPVTG